MSSVQLFAEFEFDEQDLPFVSAVEGLVNNLTNRYKDVFPTGTVIQSDNGSGRISGFVFYFQMEDERNTVLMIGNEPTIFHKLSRLSSITENGFKSAMERALLHADVSPMAEKSIEQLHEGLIEYGYHHQVVDCELDEIPIFLYDNLEFKAPYIALTETEVDMTGKISVYTSH